MTIDEAIVHCEERAKINRELSEVSFGNTFTKESCRKCAEEHEQLAAWLNELKILREVHGTVYRNEKCDRAGKCYDYIGYHCVGCNGCKKGGAE